MIANRAVGVPLAAAVGYLAGTFPSADVATVLADAGVGDLRAAGTRNPGAVNAAALLGRRWGVAVLAADIGKGAVAGAAGRTISGAAGAYAAATAAIAGHIAPARAAGRGGGRRRGGKGVATSAGACLAVFPAYFPIDAAVAGAGAALSGSAERTIRWSCAVWVAASVLWWQRRLPNAWGPEPTAGLPMFAATGSAMILARFRLARRAS